MMFEKFFALTLAERFKYLQQHEPKLHRESCNCEVGDHYWIERGGVPTTMPEDLPSTACKADNFCMAEYQRLIDSGMEVCAKCEALQDRIVCRDCEGMTDD